MSDASVLAHYERYIEDVIRKDVARLEAERAELDAQVAAWVQLEMALEPSLPPLPPAMEALVDLGGVAVPATVEDPGSVFVDVGRDIWVEMRQEEARKFVPERRAFVMEQWNALTEKIVSAKSHLREMESLVERLRQAMWNERMR